MKKTYKYLAFAFGMILMDSTCYATQEKQPPKQENNANQQENVYKQILAAIPPDNPERRNAFLAEVCRALATKEGEKKDNRGESVGDTTIKNIVCDKLKEKDSTLTADSPEVTTALENLQDEKTWNNDSSGLEDVKDAVQEFVQNQGAGFFSAGDQYENEMREDFRASTESLQGIRLSEDDNLKKLFDFFNYIGIGCPGCALTCDLIMDIVRQVLDKLCNNPDDQQAWDVVNKLLDVMKFAIGENIKERMLAHDIPGLPRLVTKIARDWKFRREFTTHDVNNLLKKLEEARDANKISGQRFYKLQEAINGAAIGKAKGVPIDDLSAAICKIAKNNEFAVMSSLINEVDEKREIDKEERDRNGKQESAVNKKGQSTLASSSSKPQSQGQINAPKFELPSQSNNSSNSNFGRSDTTQNIGGYGGGATPQTTAQQPGKSFAAKKPYTPTTAQLPSDDDPTSSSSSSSSDGLDHHFSFNDPNSEDDTQSPEEKWLDQQYEEKSENPGVKVWVLRTHLGKPELIIDVYKNKKCNEYTVDSKGNCRPGLTANDSTLVQVEPVSGYPNMHNVLISDGNANNKINLTCKFENNKCGVMLRDTNYNGKLVVEADLVGKAGNANVNDLVIKSNDDYFVNYGQLNTSNLCIFAHKINNYGIFNGQPTALMPTVNNVYKWLNAGLDSIQADSNKFYNHPFATCNATQITTRYIGESIFEGNTHVDTIDSDRVVTLGQSSKGYYCDIHKIKAQKANIYVEDGNLNYSMGRYNWNSGSIEASHVNEIVNTSDQQMNPIVKQ